MVFVEMTVDAVRHSVPMKIWTLLLRENGISRDSGDAARFLPIRLYESQARMIADVLASTRNPDIEEFMAGANAKGATVESGSIVRLENENFFAHLTFHREDKHCRVEFSPATVVAIAVRAGVPILVEETVLDQAGAKVSHGWPWGVCDAVRMMAKMQSNRRKIAVP